jgi:hypothetical protein
MSIVDALLQPGFPAVFLLLCAFATVVAALLFSGILLGVHHERRVRKEVPHIDIEYR